MPPGGLPSPGGGDTGMSRPCRATSNGAERSARHDRDHLDHATSLASSTARSSGWRHCRRARGCIRRRPARRPRPWWARRSPWGWRRPTARSSEPRARTRRKVHGERPRAGHRRRRGDLGAAFPAVFFLLAAAGVMDLAFTLSKWTGLGLIAVYGYVAARLSGSGLGGVRAAAVGAIGSALIALKALVH